MTNSCKKTKLTRSFLLSKRAGMINNSFVNEASSSFLSAEGAFKGCFFLLAKSGSQWCILMTDRSGCGAPVCKVDDLRIGQLVRDIFEIQAKGLEAKTTHSFSMAMRTVLTTQQ